MIFLAEIINEIKKISIKIRKRLKAVLCIYVEVKVQREICLRKLVQRF